MTITVNQKVTLSAKLLDALGADQEGEVDWTQSDNETVVKLQKAKPLASGAIDPVEGRKVTVLPVAPGTATITATAIRSGKTASTSLTVVAGGVASVAIEAGAPEPDTAKDKADRAAAEAQEKADKAAKDAKEAADAAAATATAAKATAASVPAAPTTAPPAAKAPAPAAPAP